MKWHIFPCIMCDLHIFIDRHMFVKIPMHVEGPHKYEIVSSNRKPLGSCPFITNRTYSVYILFILTYLLDLPVGLLELLRKRNRMDFNLVNAFCFIIDENCSTHLSLCNSVWFGHLNEDLTFFDQYMHSCVKIHFKLGSVLILYSSS